MEKLITEVVKKNLHISTKKDFEETIEKTIKNMEKIMEKISASSGLTQFVGARVNSKIKRQNNKTYY